MYKQKYLKYKTKYLRQRGGGDDQKDDETRTILSSTEVTIHQDCLYQINTDKYTGTALNIEFANDCKFSKIKLVLLEQPIDNIQSIKIPSSVTSLSPFVFEKFPRLQKVTFATDSQKKTKITTIADNAFTNHKSLKYIELPSSIQTLGDQCFYSCSELCTVEFADNSELSEIGKNAFQLCTNITTITIPESVERIKEYCFSDCPDLQINFDIDSNILEICKHAIHPTSTVQNLPDMYGKIKTEQESINKESLSEYTTIGFEIQINGEYTTGSDSIYKHLTHITVYEASSDSDLKWFIETDYDILEFVTPTFYVKKNKLIENIKSIYNAINTMFNGNIKKYYGKSITDIVTFLNDTFKIQLCHKPIMINDDSLMSNSEYLGDRKNIITDIDWVKLPPGTNQSVIPYTVHRSLDTDIFEVEAINVAHTAQEINKLFNTENVFPYVNDEIRKAYTDFYNNYIINTNIEHIDTDNVIFTFLQYEIYRLMFYHINTHLCANKGTTPILENDTIHPNKYLSGILTKLKTHSVWFKFDILTFIKLGNLQLSDSGKHQCTNMQKNIATIDNDIFTNLIQTIVSKLVEEEDNKSLLKDTVNEITDKMYKAFVEKTEQLLTKLATPPNETRQLKCNNNPQECGECVSNFLDYNRQFYGIRHDTYIENALVVEYRNVDLLIT